MSHPILAAALRIEQYSFTNTMLSSRDVLYGMFEKEEALDVMLKNPAVLQCGPSLDTLGRATHPARDPSLARIHCSLAPPRPQGALLQPRPPL